MSGASPSTLPCPLPEQAAPVRPKTLPLRAGEVPRSFRLRNPQRAKARQYGAATLDDACARRGVGNGEIAAALGLKTDREAAELRTGGVAFEFGQVAQIAEDSPAVALDCSVELLKQSVAIARLRMGNDRLRLISHLLDTILSSVDAIDLLLRDH